MTPFEDGSKLAIVNANVSFPDQPKVSVEFKALVMSMLTVDPNKRPDIDDILEQLSPLVKTHHTRVIPKKSPKVIFFSFFIFIVVSRQLKRRR